MNIQKFIAAMRKYGRDIDDAVERFLDDTELYAECLPDFLNDPGFDELGRVLKDGDYQQAFNISHTLKGVAGNLGLTPLFGALNRMVEPLRHGEYSGLDEKYADILKERENIRQIAGL